MDGTQSPMKIPDSCSPLNQSVSEKISDKIADRIINKSAIFSFLFINFLLIGLKIIFCSIVFSFSIIRLVSITSTHAAEDFFSSLCYMELIL
jgi:hypothetical protein